MIRFRVASNERHPDGIVFLGLSDANITRLRAGQPIRINAKDQIGLGVEVVIFHGATEVEMAHELEEFGFLPEGSTELTRKAIATKGEFRFGSTEP